MKRTAIGIDLGMSTTIISSFSIGLRKSPEIVTISNQKIIPTVVRLGDEPGCVVEFGKRALKEANEFPESTLFNFKSAIGTGESLQTQFGSVTADDICIWFLKAICDNLVKVQYGSSSFCSGLVETKIGYPVHWSPERRQALERIATEAGFPNAEAIPEPLGTALYHLFRSCGVAPPAKTKTLIIDFGALTTDISVIAHDLDGLTLPKPLGGADMGGVNVDQTIAEIMADDILQETGRDDLEKNEKKNLILIAESLKQGLKDGKNHATTRYADNKTLSYIDLRLEKSVFEEATESYRSDLAQFIRSTITNNGITPQEISQVLLAGGMSNMYFTNKLVCDALPDVPADVILKDPDPQCVIAKGLACAGDGLPQILEKLRGRICLNIEAAVERVKSQLLSEALEDKLAQACRSALDDVWTDVSVKEMLRYKLSLFKKIEECPSVITIKNAVTPAITSTLEPELAAIMTRFTDELQIGISMVLRQFQHNISRLCSVGSNKSPDEVVGGALENTTDGFGGAVGAGVAATITAIISSQMMWVSGILFVSLNPVSLAALIVAAVVGMAVSAHTMRKLLSFKGKLTSKIVADLGIREPNPKRKQDAGGLLYRLWHDSKGLEWELSRIEHKLWSGTQPDGTIIRDSKGEHVPTLEAEAKRIFTDVAAPGLQSAVVGTANVNPISSISEEAGQLS